MPRYDRYVTVANFSLRFAFRRDGKRVRRYRGNARRRAAAPRDHWELVRISIPLPAKRGYTPKDAAELRMNRMGGDKGMVL